MIFVVVFEVGFVDALHGELGFGEFLNDYRNARGATASNNFDRSVKVGYLKQGHFISNDIHEATISSKVPYEIF